MSRKVFVTSDMGQDEDLFNLAEEDWQAALLWPWLLTAFDDWGRAEANAHKLKSRIFPDWPGLSRQCLEAAIQLFAKHGLIVLYEVADKRYMAVDEEAWRRYQTHIRYDRKGKTTTRIPDPPQQTPAYDGIPDYPGTSGNIPDTPGNGVDIPGKSCPSPSPPPSVPKGTASRVRATPPNALVEAAWSIPGWKPDAKDEGTIAAGVTRLGEAKARDVIVKLHTRQAATGQYKNLRKTLAAWFNREDLPEQPPNQPPGRDPTPYSREIDDEERAYIELVRQQMEGQT